MNTFKFAGVDGQYIIAIPYGNGWLTIEEGFDGTITEYQYVPNLGKEIHTVYTKRGVKYLYGNKHLYLKHCTFKYVPSWAVAGSTI